MTKLKLVGLSLGLWVSSQSRAEVPASLDGVIQSALQAMESQVCQVDQAPTQSLLKNRFLLNISPWVAVGLHGFLSLKVTPEIELAWERIGDRE